MQQDDDDIIFQGDGSDKTILEFTVGNDNYCFYFRGKQFNPAVTIRSNIPKGLHYLDLTAHSFSAGDWIRFCETNFSLRDHWVQIGQVTQMETDTTMVDAASKNYAAANELKAWKLDPVANIGIENLKIICRDKKAGGDKKDRGNTICFEYAVNGWIKGVESVDAARHHVYVRFSSHLEISGCYFHGAVSHEGSYGDGVVLEQSSTNCLIENNIFADLRHAMLVQAGANCNVFDFNFSTDEHATWHGIRHSLSDLCLHGNYPHANLFEYNIVEFIAADDSHGDNGPYNAYVRNLVQKKGKLNRIELYRAPYTAVLGCEVKTDYRGIEILKGTSFSVEEYGFVDTYSISHNSIQTDEKSQCYLNDLSYYYQSVPYFLA